MKFLWYLALIIGFSTSYAAETKRPLRVLCIGDSLTAGYGVENSDSYPAILASRLKEAAFPNLVVINGGVSGATSQAGESMLTFQFKQQKPDLVLLNLGANDGLRGLPVDNLRRNLQAALQFIKAAKVRTILIGMKAPRNMGVDYIREFDATYPILAKEFEVPLIPFILEGVVGERKLNQPDGIHPNRAGYEVIVNLIHPYVEKELRELL